MNLPTITGRGSHFNPANRFSRIAYEPDPDASPDNRGSVRTEYYADNSKSVVTENNSPDVPFRFSVNPYRGCSHGCSYCFARPTHEYLDLGAGLDFETKIFVKHRAPDLFRDWLRRPSYKAETVAISGVTDCYQPVEKQLGITRKILEVALDARQPVAIITKNALVLRDLDLLSTLASLHLVRVCLSVTTLDQALAKVMEPRTGSPAARLRAIRELSAAGVPVSVLVAPVIPALTDHEFPAILKAVKEAGAHSAGYVLLRLPGSVQPVFREWLARTQPGLKDKVESRIRATRGGEWYQNAWGERMAGTGEIAEQIGQTFDLFSRRLGLDEPQPPLDVSRFRRPVLKGDQRSLFEESPDLV